MNGFGRRAAGLAIIAALAAATYADIVINYTADAGGSNNSPLNGLSARGTFTISGKHLTVLLENTSTDLPAGFDTAASLLVSLGMNLGTDFQSGNAAVIGPGSIGLGKWSNLGSGDSVANEWVFSNDGAGDLLQNYQQVITTSSGLGGAAASHFGTGAGNISGPYGGIAADPVLKEIPKSQRAVSDSIFFDITLVMDLSEEQLAAALDESVVEFGSDVRYLKPDNVVVPAPGAALLAAVGFAFARRVRTA